MKKNSYALMMMSIALLCTFYLSVHLPAESSEKEDGFVLIQGGTFEMGSDFGASDEQPVHSVALSTFYISKYEVTNREFARFVEATGYVTQAEKDGYTWGFTEEMKDAGDFQQIMGGNWRHPNGPESSITDKMDHPMVCVSWYDAQAYAEWAGVRLPSEAEWEFAGRGGNAPHIMAKPAANVSLAENTSNHAAHTEHSSSAHADHSSHNNTNSDTNTQASHPSAASHVNHGLTDAQPAGGMRFIEANFWQGVFPVKNELADGYFYTSPVGSFPPNDVGIHDMIGNVWEWCSDWYGADYFHYSSKENPTGPEVGQNRVARGGSWFCSANYCGAYNTHFRGASPPSHTFTNVGFRVAKDAKEVEKEGGSNSSG